MGKLTVKELEALNSSDDGKKLREDGGLLGSVRIGTNGPSVYFDWRYRFDGKVKQIAVGTWPKTNLAAIRAERDRLRVEVDNGINPAERRKAERLKAKADQIEATTEQQQRLDNIAVLAARLTVNDLFNRWASVDLARRKDGGIEVRRMFEKDVLPRLGSMAVEDVRKGHITGVTDALLARGVTRMAKLIFSLLRQMFRFAVDRDIIEFEPTAAIRKAKIGGKDTERDRVLSDDEIKALVKQLPNAGLSTSTKAAVWLALSTCCRIGELLGARWEHIDFEMHTWWIPPENSKNGKAHTVYLSDFASVQFQHLKDLSDEALAKARIKNKEEKAIPWVYPNRKGTDSVCQKTVTKQLGDRQRPGLQPMSGRAKAELAETLVLKGGRWGPHDLRRTGATQMVSLGVLPEVAERCLNHTEQNRVKRTYQRHSYENEMREAWRLLGERLELLMHTDAANVVALRRA